MLMKQSVGERIRFLRRQMGVSQEELAERIGISAKHLSKIERDETSFTVQILMTLSKSFGVSTDYILTGESYTLSDKEKMLVLLNE
ncbi:MAG: helix-turn-helix transcriptional regulator [Lachnospiraceae bacterium]|nr:helix-turn-helix transcriptional regulator [Lachnospiraceae bacterium]